MNDWLKSIHYQIDKQVEEYISVKDYRFYHIARLKEVASRISGYEENNCVVCRSHKKQIEKLAQQLSKMVNGTGVQRKQYENRLEGMITHLRDKHGVYPAFYFAYLYSFRYMMGGIGLGIISSYAIFMQFQWNVLLICLGLGIVVGNITGSRKDSQIRRSGKQLQ